jgi:hypothetical protein
MDRHQLACVVVDGDDKQITFYTQTAVVTANRDPPSAATAIASTVQRTVVLVAAARPPHQDQALAMSLPPSTPRPTPDPPREARARPQAAAVDGRACITVAYNNNADRRPTASRARRTR